MEVLSRSDVASWLPILTQPIFRSSIPSPFLAPRRRRRRVSWSVARVAAGVFWDPMPSLGARFVSIFLSTDE